jgi:hypothetical protein
VDENGRAQGENQVYAICGFVRSSTLHSRLPDARATANLALPIVGESDDALNRLAQREYVAYAHTCHVPTLRATSRVRRSNALLVTVAY